MRASLVVIFALAAAGCVAPPPRVGPVPAPVASPPRPAPMSTPMAADWRDWPVTGGAWTYTRDDYSTLARFSTGGVTISCDNDRRVRIRLDGGAGGTPLTVRTSTVTRTLPTGALGHPPTGLAATLTPADPLLDAMAFSRGRFALSTPGAPPLVLPAWAEVGRVVEDCRGEPN